MVGWARRDGEGKGEGHPARDSGDFIPETPWHNGTFVKSGRLRYARIVIHPAHCSVHMPKHLSEEAGPSDRCAMPS